MATRINHGLLNPSSSSPFPINPEFITNLGIFISKWQG